nr:MAG TPA: hypothetical protein [Caudoviricetes sp.]
MEYCEAMELIFYSFLFFSKLMYHFHNLYI